MDRMMLWLNGLELSAMQIVSIVIFFIYILASAIGFMLICVAGRGYLDLAKGLRRILERQEQAGQLGDIPELSGEIRKYYERYAKMNPAVNQRYPSIICWMDDILLQTNMFSDSTRGRKKKYGIWFDEYYDALMLVQRYYEQEYPFYRCSSSQAQILKDISGLKKQENSGQIETILRKTEEEFIRMNSEGKKNERANYISIAIGVAGILVSVLLTLMQMFG